MDRPEAAEATGPTFNRVVRKAGALTNQSAGGKSKLPSYRCEPAN